VALWKSLGGAHQHAIFVQSGLLTTEPAGEDMEVHTAVGVLLNVHGSVIVEGVVVEYVERQAVVPFRPDHRDAVPAHLGAQSLLRLHKFVVTLTDADWIQLFEGNLYGDMFITFVIVYSLAVRLSELEDTLEASS
jgi:hypothetical protein